MRKTLLLIFLISIVFRGYSQTSIFFNPNPYPSPYINDWYTNSANLGAVNIVNNSNNSLTVKFKLMVALTGKGDILISNSSDIILPPLQTTVLVGNQILKINDVQFPQDQLREQVVQSGRLPEGKYTVCLQMRNANGTLLDTKCGYFTIIYPQPPRLVTPWNFTSVYSKYPVFQWTPVMVPIDYKIKQSLKIVEILPGQNHYDAITSNYPHYVNENINGDVTSFQYPLSGLPLEKEKKYAWQISVVDQYGLPPTSNKGKSEIFTFTMDDAQNQNPLALKIISPANHENVSVQKPVFRWSVNPTTYKQKLIVVEVKSGQTLINAFFNPPFFTKIFEPNVSTITSDTVMHFEDGKQYAVRTDLINKNNEIVKQGEISRFKYVMSAYEYNQSHLSTVMGYLKYNFHTMSQNENGFIPTPLKNANIKLEIRYVLKSKKFTGVGHTENNNSVFVVPDAKLPLEFRAKNKKLLATGTTGNQGQFYFNFINYDTIGAKVGTDIRIGETSPEHANYFTGDLYMVARLIVLAPHKTYYTSPSEDIEILPGEIKTYDLVTLARTYNLNVTIKPSEVTDQYTSLPISDMKVYVLRKNRAEAVPKNEGIADPNNKRYFDGLEIVGEGITGGGVDDRGQVLIKSLIKNTSFDDAYYLYAENNAESGNDNYKTSGKLFFGFSIKDDNAEFADEYPLRQFNREFIAQPQLPSVWGRLQRSDNGHFLSAVDVMMITSYPTGMFNWYMDTRQTNINGYFPRWDNLDVVRDATGLTNGPTRTLYITKNGYQTLSEDVGILRPGQKYFKNLILTPECFVTGKVANQNGLGIGAFVKIGDGLEVEAQFTGKQPNGIPFPYKFSTQAVKELNQKMIIRPKNTGMYFTDTIMVNITSANQDLGTFKLQKKTHKIYLSFIEKASRRRSSDPPINIKFANVKIKVQNEWLQKSTTNGWINFEFTNDGEDFPIEVTSSEGYRKYISVIHNSVSKEYVPYIIRMEKGSSVTGRVFVGKDNKPVPNAHVFFNSGLNSVHTNTDINGNYVLEGLPQNVTVTINATKNAKDTTFVGDEKSILLGTSGATLDFNLSVYEGMDITNLMGFPVEVTKLNEQNGNVLISGNFINIKDNQQFTLSDKNTIVSFDTVQIKPSVKTNSKGIPIAEAVKSTVFTNINNLNVAVYNTFEANIYDNKIGVHLAKASGEGIIKGEVSIKPTAFNTYGSITNLSGMNVYAPFSSGVKDKIIGVFTYDGSNPINAPSGLRIAGTNGNSLKFKLSGYDAYADSSLSTILFDTVKLSTKLNLYNAKLNPKNIKLDIGNVVLHKNSIEPINSTKVIDFGMGNWTLSGKKWFIDNSDLTITEGELKTKTINIPVKKLIVEPDQFGYQEFDLTQLTIGGIIPLYVIGNPVLNYDDYKSQWSLYVSKDTNNYCAYLKDLPALQQGSNIFIEAISLYSNEASKFSVWSAQQPIKIYSVGILRPTTFFSYDNYITISGLSLTPAVPKLNLSNWAIRYMKGADNKPLFMVDPQSFSLQNKGVIAMFSKNEMQAKNTILDATGFRSYGTVYEPGVFDGNKSVKSWFFHTPDSTVIFAETPNSKFSLDKTYWQRMPIGSSKTYLDSLRGGMNVVGNDWTNFTFTGELLGTKGISTQNTMTFKVYGDVIAENQTLSVKDIPFSFGAMSWSFDFANSRLRGSFSISTQNMNGMELTDVGAECLVDNAGWYFIAGGKVKVPGLGPMTAALLFGDYPSMTQEVKNKFANNSYSKGLPKSFQNNISGILFSGSVQVPVIVPNLDVDVVVARASFGVLAGFDARVWMNFSSTGNEYGIGMIGFLNAHLSMSSITCTSFGANATVEVGANGIYKNGSINLSGCGSLSIAAYLTQKVPLVVGCGSTIFSLNKSFNFKCDITPSSVVFGTGTCSGNNL